MFLDKLKADIAAAEESNSSKSMTQRDEKWEQKSPREAPAPSSANLLSRIPEGETKKRSGTDTEDNSDTDTEEWSPARVTYNDSPNASTASNVHSTNVHCGDSSNRFMYQTSAYHQGLQHSATLMDVAVASFEWTPFIVQGTVICYMVMLLIYFACVTPRFLMNISVCWLWSLELLYFIYSLYLDVLTKFIGGQRNLVSYIARSFTNIIREVAFWGQVIVVMHFWFSVFPSDLYGQWSFLKAMNPYGGGLLLIIGDSLARKVGGWQFEDFKKLGYLFSVYLAVILPVSMASGFAASGMLVMPLFVVFLCAGSVFVITHKIMYVLENSQRVVESARALIGMLYLISTEAEEGGEGESPTNLQSMIRRCATTIRGELLDPLQGNKLARGLTRGMTMRDSQGRVSFNAIPLEGGPDACYGR